MKKILFVSLMIFMAFITSKAFADSTQNIGYGSAVTVSVIISNITSNFSYVPSTANFTLDPNQALNFTFNITNPVADGLNISFRSQRFTNFSINDFILSNETRSVTAQLIPFNDSGIFNDSIQIARRVDSTLEVIGQIFINFEVGKLPGGNFTFMKCFIENGYPKCDPVNITEFANITIINETVENVTRNEYFAVGREFLTELINSMKNNSDIIQKSLESRKTTYENVFVLYNIVNSKTGKLWYDISPENELINVTGMTSDEISEAIGSLLEQGLVVEETRDEEIETPTKTGYLVRTVQITSIASTDKVKEKQDADSFNLGLIISVMLIIITGIVIVIIILLRKRLF